MPPSEFPGNDPKNVWQNQATEPFSASLDELRRKAKHWQARARLKTLFSIILGLALSSAFATIAITGRDIIPRLGAALLSLWSIYFAYQARRWLWPDRLEPHASASASLQFYRRELEKRRDYNKHLWRRAGLTFCFVGLALMVVPGVIKAFPTPRLLVNFAPFFVLLVAWFVLFFLMRKRQQGQLQHELDKQGQLQREIDELRALESDNSS
jgi:uncharacterized membrane protein YfcA